LHPLADGSRSAAVAGRSRRASASARSLDEACSALASRLRERQPEIQAAIATRVYAISDPHDVADPAYLQGLDAALAAAIEHRLAVLEVGERRAPAVPPVLLAQARLDARDGVPLDTVLRRYFAGNSLFGDFLVEEAERAEVPSSALRRLLAAQATLGDRLLAAVSAEHAREAKNWPSSTAERRRECVKSLLAGELVDRSAKGNFRSLGKRFGKDTPKVAAAVAAADAAALAAALRETGQATVLVDGEEVTLAAEDVLLTETPREGWSVVTASGETVALDLTMTEELRRAGLAREVVRLVQEARKSAGFEVTDRVAWVWSARDETAAAIEAHLATICDEVLAVSAERGTPTADGGWLTEDPDLGLAFSVTRSA